MLEDSSIIAVTASRDLCVGDDVLIELAIAELVRSPQSRQEIRFGGARGGDSIALRAAHDLLGNDSNTLLSVYVPSRLADQPVEARLTIEACADHVVELGLPVGRRTSYHARNRAMLEPLEVRGVSYPAADGLIAFWNGRGGGTSYTIAQAESRRVPVVVVGLGEPNGDRPRRRRLGPNPRHHLPGADIYVHAPYVTARFGKADPLSAYVRRAKARLASRVQHTGWGKKLGDSLEEAFPRRRFTVVVPVPRRVPGRQDDLALLAATVAKRIGAADGTGLLERVREPRGGKVTAYRLRHSPAAHAASMRVDTEHPAFDPRMHVVLLDNVIATGGTMTGAVEALRRDVPGASITGAVLTGALNFEPERN
ncbi:MAG TPA: hypothetical protein VIY27_07835 [Myxococcota bacterium]